MPASAAAGPDLNAGIKPKETNCCDAAGLVAEAKPSPPGLAGRRRSSRSGASSVGACDPARGARLQVKEHDPGIHNPTVLKVSRS